MIHTPSTTSADVVVAIVFLEGNQNDVASLLTIGHFLHDRFQTLTGNMLSSEETAQ